LDKVTIKNISLYAYHGILPEEQERGQEFIVDVDLFSHFHGLSLSDDLNQVIDYRLVLEEVTNTVTGNRYQLLEALTEQVALNLLKFAGVHQVVVTVKKPRPPLPGVTGGVQVTVERKKHSETENE